MSKNKKWSAAQKFEIAVQALKGEVTLSELCKKYDVSPSQVQTWKKHLLEEGSSLYSKKESSVALEAEHEKQQRVLREKVGELLMENDYLKKCARKLIGKTDKY